MERRERGGNCHTTPGWRNKTMTRVGNASRQPDNAIMTGSSKDSTKSGKSPDRKERLAMELRENLRRRKAQERGRAPSSASGEPMKPKSASRKDGVP